MSECLRAVQDDGIFVYYIHHMLKRTMFQDIRAHDYFFSKLQFDVFLYLNIPLVVVEIV